MRPYLEAGLNIGMSDLLSLQQLQREFGLSNWKARKLITEGLPVVTEADRSKGIQWAFSRSEVEDWFDQRSEDEEPVLTSSKAIEQARIEKLRVQTEREQLRLDKERGELVPIEDVLDIVTQQYASLRAHLLAIPQKASPLVVGRTDVREIEDTLTRYIKEALEELQEGATATG